MIPEEGGDEEVESSSHLLGAIKTILIADLVMSTDNVIAVAAVAKDSIALLVLGLVISIPLVIFGATILMKLMPWQSGSTPTLHGYIGARRRSEPRSSWSSASGSQSAGCPFQRTKISDASASSEAKSGKIPWLSADRTHGGVNPIF